MQGYRLWVRRLIRYGALALLALSLIVLSHLSISGLTFGDGAAWAQSSPASFSRRLQRGELSEAIYQRLPDLPLENQYVNVRTGVVDPTSTLADRLVRYHVYTKGRITQYRLDWKLTLADYLGANERMDAERYPFANRLTVNPMAGDREVIVGLNRRDRDQLVQVLVEVCHPELVGTLGGPDDSDTAGEAAQDGADAPSQPAAGAGAADLLR